METTYYFQYGRTTGYGAKTAMASAGAGTATIPVSAAVVGLAAGTTYHFRLVASSAGGTVHGADRSFTTKSVPLKLTIRVAQSSIVYGASVMVSGTLTGTGSAGREVVLQTDPFPFTAGYRPFGNAEVTTAAGTFSFAAVAVALNSYIRVESPGKPNVLSGAVLERVAAKVLARVSRTRRRGFVRIFGTVSPAMVGARVAIEWRRHGGAYRYVGETLSRPLSATASRFSRVVRVRHRPGMYRVVVFVPGHTLATGHSRVLRIR